MVPVQQKYRWGSFAALSVQDGQGRAWPYPVFKKRLAASLAGVRVDAGQGQWDRAAEHLRTLRSQLEGLGETCTACHARQPQAFLSPAALGELERELAGRQPSSAAVAGLLQSLGGQACAGCHLVHVPAAMAQASRP